MSNCDKQRNVELTAQDRAVLQDCYLDIFKNFTVQTTVDKPKVESSTQPKRN